MKITNKQEFQQKTVKNLLHIDFKDFINLYKRGLAKPYSFFSDDTTVESDNPLSFRKNILKK